MATSQGTFQRGQTVCRPSDWKDVVQFFLLNYGLHAVTVLTEPGSTTLSCALASFTAILMPSVGTARAVDEISRFAITGCTDLDVARRAGALCMLAPAYPSNEYPKMSIADSQESSSADGEISHSHGRQEPSQEPTDQSPPEPVPNYSEVLTGVFVPISTYLRQVHGEYPTDIKKPGIRVGGRDSEAGNIRYPSPLDYCLIEVPQHFEVSQFLGPAKNLTHLQFIRDWFKKAKVPTEPNPQRDSIIAPTIASPSTCVEKPEMVLTVSPKDGINRSEPVTAHISLASSYNLVKTVAAILQMLYGSYELYEIGKQQLDRHGYVSYQLTVIPYILMSSAKLFASMTGPRYSSRYLVHYGLVKRKEHGDTQETQAYGTDKSFGRGWWNKRDREEVEKRISGAVGLVYGKFLEDGETEILIKKPECYRGYGTTGRAWQNIQSLIPTWLLKKGKVNFAWVVVTWLLSLAFLAAPYVIIYLLTKFNPGESTLSQRSWIMCWFVLGQVGSILLSIVVGLDSFQRYAVRHRIIAVQITKLVTALLSVSSMRGFVVGAKMILGKETCQKL